MNTNKQGKTPIYENGFKISLAREYLTSNHGYGALAAKYDLPGPATVRYFVKWYKKNYGETPCHTQPVTENEITYAVNDKQLSKQLKEANLKIAGLEILIETARKELGIDIIKKPGTKQL